MTLQPIIPGYTSPAEPEYTYTCPRCHTKGDLYYRQRGEHVTRIKVNGSISSSKPYLRLLGIPHLVCAHCKHPVDDRSGIHQAIMSHMRDV